MKQPAALPLVSVVIPVHNGDRFIAAAIDSALGQTYGRTEIVVVDDGSTDGTADILAGYGSAITVIRQQRSGVAASRNRAVASSRGELIALLDADDVWRAGKLDRQVDLWSRGPEVGLLLAGYDVVDERLRTLYRVPLHAPGRRIRRAATLDAWGIGLSFTGMFTRRAFEAVGGFRNDLSTSADLDFSLRLTARGGVAGVRDCLAMYRTHGAQMHLDGALMERDMLDLLAGFVSDDDAALRRDGRRGVANVHARRGLRAVRDGDMSEARVHLAQVLRSRPDRLVTAPTTALARRAYYRLLALARPGDTVR